MSIKGKQKGSRSSWQFHCVQQELRGFIPLCRVTMLATYLSAVLALLLLWNVYPKDFDYGAAAGNGLLFYNANVSCLPSRLA